MSQRIADDLVPRNISSLRYECPDDEEDEQYTFYKHVKYAKKIEIRNILGNENHLKTIKEIG